MVIQKITIFIAHPDDTDNYAANFIKHLVDKGKEVFLYSFTRGEHGVGSSKDPRKDEFRGKRLDSRKPRSYYVRHNNNREALRKNPKEPDPKSGFFIIRIATS